MDDQNLNQINQTSSIKPEEEIKSLQNEIKSLEEKNRQLETGWLRALADYQNFQKRVSLDNQRQENAVRGVIILKFLDVLDHLETAQKNLNDDGLALVIQLFKKILEEEKVTVMEREGQEFDPTLDECVDKQKGEKNNIIVRVVRKGYLLKDLVLRPAQVIVEIKNN